MARRIEAGLYFTRFLTIFAVIGSLLSAVALFLKGTLIVVYAIKDCVVRQPTCIDYDELLKMLVSSVDVFLFAMVLIIFGIGVYELFVSKIDPIEQKVTGKPSWMQISSLDELKGSLGKVILMVLIVTFFKHSIEIHYANITDLLQLGVGIVLVALSLYITSKSSH